MRLKEYNYLYGQIQSTFREYAVKFQMSGSDIDIFYILYTHDGSCLQSDLYKESGLGKSTVNSAVKKLQKDGYVYISEKDGRDTHVFFTEQGKEYVMNTVYKMIHAEMNFFDSLSEEEYQTFTKINMAYLDALKKGLEVE